MKKTSNEIRFETQVPLREVMTNPTSIGIEATVAEAAKAMCRLRLAVSSSSRTTNPSVL